jgi:hypothetical protein
LSGFSTRSTLAGTIDILVSRVGIPQIQQNSVISLGNYGRLDAGDLVSDVQSQGGMMLPKLVGCDSGWRVGVAAVTSYRGHDLQKAHSIRKLGDNEEDQVGIDFQWRSKNGTKI